MIRTRLIQNVSRFSLPQIGDFFLSAQFQGSDFISIRGDFGAFFSFLGLIAERNP